MKSIAAFALFVTASLCAAPAARGQEDGEHHLVLEAEAGFLYGTSYEIVYLYSNGMNYLSELQWQIRPLWYAGLAAAWVPQIPLRKRGLFAEGSVKVGLPGGTGDMEDRDWMPAGRNDDGVTVPSSFRPGALTHFSSHENRTTLALFADMRGGFSFPIENRMYLRLFLDFSYMLFTFEAWNGYRKYWTDNFNKIPLSGRVMEYTQHWLMLSPGFEVVFTLGGFSLSAGLSVSPLNLCFSIDNHLLRNLKITDVMLMGLYVEPEAGASFTFGGRFTLGVSVSYRHIEGTRGNSQYVRGGASEPWLENIGGAGFRAFRGALRFRYAL